MGLAGARPYLPSWVRNFCRRFRSPADAGLQHPEWPREEFRALEVALVELGAYDTRLAEHFIVEVTRFVKITCWEVGALRNMEIRRSERRRHRENSKDGPANRQGD